MSIYLPRFAPCGVSSQAITAAASVLALGATAPAALAQLTPDATLGNENSVINNGAIVGGEVTDLIEGGATRGGNLFHSFLEFNIADGQRVFFANPLGIENILSRVTGGDPSNIFGTLGVDGPANLFFTNPNGIVFGPDATLDIPGSFHATTADAIPLGDAGFFSATAPEQSTLLTVDPSVAFTNYLTADSGDITSQGQLAAAGDMTLAANTLDLVGQVAAGDDLTLLGLDTVQIRDAVEAPFIGFAGGDLLVQGNEQVDIVALSHPDSGLYSYGDLVLRSANPVGGDARYWSAGNFQVETLDGEVGDLFSPVDPIIRTFNDVVIDEYEGSSLHILAGGSVNLGTATITAPDAGDLDIDFLREDITLSDGTLVQIDGGTQPTLDVRAGVSSEALGEPPLQLLTGFNNNTADGFIGNAFVTGQPSSADITIGDVAMNAADSLVLLTSNYEPNDNLEGGDINITGEGTFGLGINARNFIGRGGTVFIDARGNLNAINSSIQTTALTEVGDIVLLAGETVYFDGADGRRPTGAFANIPADSEDIAGGTVRIGATNLEVLNGAQIASLVFGNGQGGDVLLSIRGTAYKASGSAIPSGAFSVIAPDSEGQGGDVRVQAGNVEVRDGANLSASTFGIGDAGNVILTVQGTVQVVGTDRQGNASGIDSSIDRGGEGRGGNVEIMARELEVLQGGQLSASTLGLGTAGSVLLDIEETASFVGANRFNGDPSGAFSSIERGGEGRGGNVEIMARELEVLQGGQLSVSTFGIGAAGSVLLDIEETASFVGANRFNGDPSGAFSSIQSGGEGRGGNIEIMARELEVLQGGQLSVSTFGIGAAGSVILNISETALFVGNNTVNGNPSGVFSTLGSDGEAEGGSEGQGGDVRVQAGNVEVQDGAELSASTFGLGNAGNVVLTVKDTVQVVGTDGQGNASSISSRINSGGEGRGGNVEITARELEVLQGGQLDVSTFGSGAAGSVLLTIEETASFIGANRFDGTPSGAFSSVERSGEGRGGNVEVQATQLEILDRAALFSASFGQGDAGTIALSIANRLLMDDGTIGTNSEGDSGGQINIKAGNIILRNDSDIQTFVANGEGGGGNITIAADFVIALDDSDILAFSADGTGGNIDLSQTTLFSENLNFAAGNLSRAELAALDGNNRVDINATGGIASGQISINDASVIENSLNELSGDLVDTAALTAGSCITRTDDATGSFVVTGGEGLPQRPGGDNIAVYPTGTVQSVAESTPAATLQEPQSVYRLADGRLVLSHECE